MRINLNNVYICQKQWCTLLTVHLLATSGQGLQAFQYMPSSPPGENTSTKTYISLQGVSLRKQIIAEETESLLGTSV